MADVLVQTTIPEKLAAYVRGAAAREGISVSAYLRRLVMQQSENAVLEAWWRSPGEKQRPTEPVARGQKPNFLFDVLTNFPGGAMEVRLLGPNRRPVLDVGLFHGGAYSSTVGDHLHEGRFLIRGSAKPWRVMRSLADRIDAEHSVVRLLLEQDNDG